MKNCPTIGVLTGIFLSVNLCTSATAETQEQRDGCMYDAFRFCSNAIPDHNQVFNCLLANRSIISPACRAMITPISINQNKRAP